MKLKALCKLRLLFKVLSDLIGDWMNFEQKWLRIILAVVIAVVGHAIAVMHLKSVFYEPSSPSIA